MNYSYYSSEMRWAEPHISHAMELMRYVYTHRNETKEKAKKLQENIRTNFSPEALGKLMKARLESF